MLEFLEAYKTVAAFVAMALAIADGVTTYLVIKRGKGREGNFIPAKLIDKYGLVPYLVVSRLVVAAALWFEPAAGWPLALLFAAVTANNVRNLK